MFLNNALKIFTVNKTTPVNLIHNRIGSIYKISTSNRHNAEASTKSEDTSFEVNPDPSLRRVRPEFPSPVKFCLIPVSWITFFHNKTGVTGFYTFIITFGTYLASKEIWILEHEFYNGLSMILLCWSGVKFVGPTISRYLDAGIDELDKDWNEGRNNEIKDIQKLIANEEDLQWSKEGETLLMVAKRQNVDVQLEYEYRKRLRQIYEEVLRRLDYQVALVDIQRRILQQNMVEWITTQVMKEITPNQDEKSFEACLMQIKIASQKHEQERAILQAKKEKEQDDKDKGKK